MPTAARSNSSVGGSGWSSASSLASWAKITSSSSFSSALARSRSACTSPGKNPTSFSKCRRWANLLLTMKFCTLVQ